MKKLLVTALMLTSLGHTQTYGNWGVLTSKDPITDVVKTSIVNNNLDGTLLLLRCTGSDLNIFIGVDEYLDDDTIDGAYRFDQYKAINVGFDAGTDGDAFFWPDSAFKHFIQSAKISKNLVVRVEDFRGTPHTYYFSMNGFGAAIKKLKCVDRYLSAKPAASPPKPTKQAPPKVLTPAEQLARPGTVLYIPLKELQNVLKQNGKNLQLGKDAVTEQYWMLLDGEKTQLNPGITTIVINKNDEVETNDLYHPPKLTDGRLWISVADLWKYKCGDLDFTKDNKKLILTCDDFSPHEYQVEFRIF